MLKWIVHSISRICWMESIKGWPAPFTPLHRQHAVTCLHAGKQNARCMLAIVTKLSDQKTNKLRYSSAEVTTVADAGPLCSSDQGWFVLLSGPACALHEKQHSQPLFRHCPDKDSTPRVCHHFATRSSVESRPSALPQAAFGHARFPRGLCCCMSPHAFIAGGSLKLDS